MDDRPAEHDAAIVIVSELLDMPSFLQAWTRMEETERDYVLSTLADGIERRVDARLHAVMRRIAEQV
jgi:hypothetical protein